MTSVRKAGNARELGERTSLPMYAGRAARWLAGAVLGRSRTGASDLRSDPTSEEERIQLLLRRGRIAAASGDIEQGLGLFEQVLKLLPDFGEAIEARASLLDLTGEVDVASREFQRYRRLSATNRFGAADRHYVLRHTRPHTDMAEYEVVVRRVKNRVFPLIAQGNLLLSRGHPAEALAYYQYALEIKKQLPDVVLLRGCALSALDRHAEAIQCFDEALASQPENRDAFNSRGISRMALGLVDDANADWRRQFELVPPHKADARACLALRLADHELAVGELAKAADMHPAEPYWQLYRLAALRRLGRDGGPAERAAEADSWPAQLFALHTGARDEAAVLALADTPRRRAEAAFHLAALALDRAVAARWWNEIVEQAPAEMIEYAAARNELSRQG